MDTGGNGGARSRVGFEALRGLADGLDVERACGTWPSWFGPEQRAERLCVTEVGNAGMRAGFEGKKGLF